MKKVLTVFSHAFVINLDSDTDRLLAISQRLETLNIPFERFPAIQPNVAEPHIGVCGCRLSHVGIVREAQRRGLESVLIMEDDAVFRDDFLEHWALLASQLQEVEFDIFYGYDWANRSSLKENIQLKRIVGTFCCHFWAIHSRFYKTFAKIIETRCRNKVNVAIDRIFNSRLAVIYAPTYNLVGQDEGRSTIDGLAKGIRWSM